MTEKWQRLEKKRPCRLDSIPATPLREAPFPWRRLVAGSPCTHSAFSPPLPRISRTRRRASTTMREIVHVQAGNTRWGNLLAGAKDRLTQHTHTHQRCSHLPHTHFLTEKLPPALSLLWRCLLLAPCRRLRTSKGQCGNQVRDAVGCRAWCRCFLHVGGGNTSLWGLFSDRAWWVGRRMLIFFQKLAFASLDGKCLLRLAHRQTRSKTMRKNIKPWIHRILEREVPL